MGVDGETCPLCARGWNPIHVLHNCSDARGEGRILWKRSGRIIKEDTAVKKRGVLQEYRTL